MKQIHYYEDDYCQIELVPIENLSDIRKKMERINSDGVPTRELVGGVSPVSISCPAVALSDLGISMRDFETQLHEFEKAEKVYWGFSDEHLCPEVSAFGKSNNTVVFAEADGQTLSTIWLTLDLYSEEDYTEARKLLQALSSLSDLLFVDWGWLFVERVRNTDKIQNYLKQRFLRFVNP